MAGNVADKAYELGKKYEMTYQGCGQCAVAALQDALNLRNDDFLKTTTGLAGGGGMASDGSCGAYIGGILILGFLFGREREHLADWEGTKFRFIFELAHKLRSRFIQEYGSVTCRDIQTKVFGRPYYFSDPDEYKKFEEAGAHDAHHCPEVVGKAARWLVELLDEEGLIPQKQAKTR